jgi:GNAT superfamily N-acetyltransferase
VPATSEIATPGSVKVRTFEAGDGPAVLDLLEVVFGDWPVDIEGATPAEFFRWKHMASPFGASILIVAENADGAIVGFQAWLRWQLSAGGRVLEAVRGVDLAVRPSHRRRGVSLAMIRKAAEYFPAEAAFTFSNPNEQSRPGSFRTGRRQVGKLATFVRPGRSRRETIRRISRRSPDTLERLPIEAMPVAEALRGGASVSGLLKQAREPTDRLATAKDLEYLRWRYGQSEQYRAIRAEVGGGIEGMAIFRLQRHGRLWIARVCELIAARNDRRIARHLLNRIGKAAPVDLVSCCFPSRRDAALCGFAPSSRGSILMVRPLRPDVAPDPTRRASWALSLGDLEL